MDERNNKSKSAIGLIHINADGFNVNSKMGYY